MDEKRINKSLQHAIQFMVPDQCEEILKMPVEKLRKQDKFIKQREKNRGIIKRVTAMAAGIFICILTGLLWYQSEENYAVVTIDVNPGITLTVNHKNQVVEAKAANAEGEEVIKRADPLKKDIRQASELIMEELYRENYFEKEKENYLLISVQKNKGIRKEIEKSAEKLPVSCEIISQTFEKTGLVKKTAQKYEITMGKAELVERIFAKVSERYNRAQLAAMNIQELLRLAQETGIMEEDDINLIHQKYKQPKQPPQSHYQLPSVNENVPAAVPAGNEVITPSGEKESGNKADSDEEEEDKTESGEDRDKDDTKDEIETPEDKDIEGSDEGEDKDIEEPEEEEEDIEEPEEEEEDIEEPEEEEEDIEEPEEEEDIEEPEEEEEDIEEPEEEEEDIEEPEEEMEEPEEEN